MRWGETTKELPHYPVVSFGFSKNHSDLNAVKRTCHKHLRLE